MDSPVLRFPECKGRTVLLASSDAAWRDGVRAALVPLRCTAVCVPDAATARALLEGGLRPDLAAVDLDAFGADAPALLRTVRERDRVRHTPLVAFARELRPETVREALAAGADDCAARCAPEAFALLVGARFRFAAVAPLAAPAVLESGPLVLDAESGRAFVDGAPADLSPTEFAMLRALVRNADRRLSREALLREMHGEGGGNVRERTVDTTILAVRRKLGPAGGRIETVRGVGYRWRAEDAERRPGPFARLLRGGAGALLVAAGFALHAGVAEWKSHAEGAEDKSHVEFAERKSHAESAEGAELGSHAEFAEAAEGKTHAESAESAELGSHAKFAEGKSHAEAAESAELGSHAEFAESAELNLDFGLVDNGEQWELVDNPSPRVEPVRPQAFTITVICTPVSPFRAESVAASEPGDAAWLETTSDGAVWTRRGRVTPASLVNTFVSSAPLRDVRIVSDAPGPPAYDVREVVLVN